MQSFTIMVDSTAIHYVSYDSDGRSLEVGFNHGKVYTYAGVPLQVAVELVSADSVGVYYNRYIKTQFSADTRLGTRVAGSARAPARDIYKKVETDRPSRSRLATGRRPW